jgi:D-glycero-beta-D-manno-heptose 1-phosphate adenylyltransferase
MSKLQKINQKIVEINAAINILSEWKNQGLKTAFTNGCFDILHKGHVVYLAKAADLADKLIVGINSDDSVRRMEKAKNRPINNENSRKIIISALEFVDLVILFDNDTPLELIQALKPDVLVKGADYDSKERNSSSKKYIVGSDFILKNGGNVQTIELEKGFSTTSIVEKINGDKK